LSSFTLPETNDLLSVRFILSIFSIEVKFFYHPLCLQKSKAQKVSPLQITVFNYNSNYRDMPQSKVLKENDLPKWVKFVSSLIEESNYQNRFQTEECEDKSGEFEYE
jgi:hypothetical protein